MSAFSLLVNWSDFQGSSSPHYAEPSLGWWGTGTGASLLSDPPGAMLRLSISPSPLQVRGSSRRVAWMCFETSLRDGRPSLRRPGELAAPRRVVLSSALCRDARPPGLWGWRGCPGVGVQEVAVGCSLTPFVFLPHRVCSWHRCECPSGLQTGGNHILVKGTKHALSADNLPVN